MSTGPNLVDGAYSFESLVDIDRLRTMFVLVARDGERREISESFSPIRDGDGAVRGAVVVFHDRTEELALRDDSRLLAAISEQAAVGIAMVDLQGRVKFANSAWAQMHGYEDGADLTGAHISVFHTPAQVAKDVLPFNEIVMDEGYCVGEVGHVRQDGSTFPTLMTSTLIRDDDRAPIGLVGVATDLTERTRLLEEKARLEEQFHHAQRMEAVGRLAGGIAHDFNNVLSAILGHASLAMGEAGADPSLVGHLKGVTEAGERAAELTRQLLAFSRKQVMEPRVIDLNKLLDGLRGMLVRLLGEDIVFTWKPGSETGHVRADVAQIEQVVVNLVVNARDAMPTGGTLVLETGAVELDALDCAEFPDLSPGAYVQLVVEDSGTGMDPATRERCFDPFFSTKEPGRGTGLGLAMVLGVVLQHEGGVRVSSEPGAGSRFEIFLPRVFEEAQPARAKSDGGMPRGGETVLLAEDEEMVRGITTLVLERLGYTVLAASSGAEALRLAAAHGAVIDLLVTDVVMPQMNGQELATRLLAERPGLRVLYTSGHPRDVLGRHGILDENLAFLGKPYSPPELAQRVREILDTSV